MFFVHSFPRRSARDIDQEKALMILSSFLKYGPLLVPEVINVPAISGNKHTQSTFEILQTRFSLTLVNESEIKSHMTYFGCISLMFDPAILLRLGVTPVFYFPSYKLNSESNEFGLSLIHQLRLILRLIQDLTVIHGINVEEFQNIMERRVSIDEFNAFRKSINILFDTMNINIDDMNIMEGAIQHLSHLLYPVDRNSSEEDPNFLYFHQKEWRFLGGFSIKGNPTTQKADFKLRNELADIDGNFFLKYLIFQENKFSRIDEVEILCEPYKSIFMSGLKQIICHQDLYNDVNQLVKDKHIFVTSSDSL